MENIGKVIETKDNFAKLEVRRASACGEKCSSCKGGCSTTGIYVNVENTLDAKPGDFVKIETETKSIMKVAFIVYLFPLFMLILGIFSSFFIYKQFNIRFSSEVFSFLVGLLFMGISYIIIRIIDFIYQSKGKLQYKIIKIDIS
ncbi:SoxR reducing system RseC family protein [Tepidibacter formicigenes]|jgi:sigma-E factor negative regulatory protein RseC|uniref:Positive regulator of sigma(E), RseC/MucC n=1 Tax=Tepidibacter formicigenes DSM 15518 TaxID=1123349 RepID=A0A1M6LK13_9FIRM|nr:SoxR reducing system RseC family protein [Tepidibacter formicigenes]SHJ71531.1 positive regulator of sigma(E), RseC/MucC [Tepidibacter formicigenes DSM 15518]